MHLGTKIIVKFRVHQITHQTILLRGTNSELLCTKTMLCSNTLKRTELNWNVIFSWTVINWHALQISYAHFRYTIWLMIFWKNCYEVHVSSCGASMSLEVSTRHTKILRTKISNSFQPLNYLHVDKWFL